MVPYTFLFALLGWTLPLLLSRQPFLASSFVLSCQTVLNCKFTSLVCTTLWKVDMAISCLPLYHRDLKQQCITWTFNICSLGKSEYEISDFHSLEGTQDHLVSVLLEVYNLMDIKWDAQGLENCCLILLRPRGAKPREHQNRYLICMPPCMLPDNGRQLTKNNEQEYRELRAFWELWSRICSSFLSRYFVFFKLWRKDKCIYLNVFITRNMLPSLNLKVAQCSSSLSPYAFNCMNPEVSGSSLILASFIATYYMPHGFTFIHSFFWDSISSSPNWLWICY